MAHSAMMVCMVGNAIALFFISLTGAFLQTNIGFGFPLLAMIFLTAMFPFSTAVAICQVIAMASTVYLTVTYRRHIAWRTMLPLLTVSLATGILVTTRSWHMVQRDLELILGAALVAISIFTVINSDRIRVRATIPSGMAMGLVAGIGNGLFGIGGPPVAIYLMGASSGKEVYLATIQCYFLLSNISTIGLRTLHGDLGWQHIWPIGAGWAGLALGTYLGLKSFRRLPQQVLRIAVYAFVGVSGLSIILKHIL